MASESVLGRRDGRVSLSKIFLWYGRDFTEEPQEMCLADEEHEVKLLRILGNICRTRRLCALASWRQEVDAYMAWA